MITNVWVVHSFYILSGFHSFRHHIYGSCRFRCRNGLRCCFRCIVVVQTFSPFFTNKRTYKCEWKTKNSIFYYILYTRNMMCTVLWSVLFLYYTIAKFCYSIMYSRKFTTYKWIWFISAINYISVCRLYKHKAYLHFVWTFIKLPNCISFTFHKVYYFNEKFIFIILLFFIFHLTGWMHRHKITNNL